jgi:hypothetical protein
MLPARRPKTQRDVMRQLLLEHGYDKRRVCAAYAAADERGEAPRASNMNNMSSERYAEEVWADGHRPRSPWIMEFCKRRGIK